MLTLDGLTEARAAEMRAEIQAVLDAPGHWKTRQELLDGTVRHLAAQGRQACSQVGGSRCVMRNNAGDKCAIGCHINDEDYRPWMDAVVGALYMVDGCTDRARKATWKVAGVSPEDAQFGSLLQTVHDTNSPYVWEESFRTICLEKGLDAAVFDEPAVAAGFKAIRARSS